MTATKLTDQDVFNTAWNHFVVNKGPRSGIPTTDHGGLSCRYRTFDDAGGVVAKCAIGLCIPDEMYDARIEQKGITGVLGGFGGHDFPKIQALFSECNATTLYAIQRCHDAAGLDGGPAFHPDIEGRLRSVARAFKLTIRGEKV